MDRNLQPLMFLDRGYNECENVGDDRMRIQVGEYTVLELSSLHDLYYQIVVIKCKNVTGRNAMEGGIMSSINTHTGSSCLFFLLLKPSVEF